MSKKFLTQDGNKIPSWRIVAFLLSVRDYLKAGVRKGTAIKISSDYHLGNTSPLMAKSVWKNRYQWLKVRG